MRVQPRQESTRVEEAREVVPAALDQRFEEGGSSSPVCCPLYNPPRSLRTPRTECSPFFFHSGMAAVLAANIVVASYAIVAIKEDRGEGGANRPKATPLKVD